jgi:hypothetical protein
MFVQDGRYVGVSDVAAAKRGRGASKSDASKKLFRSHIVRAYYTLGLFARVYQRYTDKGIIVLEK